MYLIYDCMGQSSFSLAAQNLLKILDIEFINLPSHLHFKPHGGYFGRVAKLENFLFANLFNIALALQNNCILLALEEDSYANLIAALNLVNCNQNFKDFIMQEFHAHNMSIDIDCFSQHIAYLPALLSHSLDKIRQKIQYYFGKNTQDSLPSISPNSPISQSFSTCLYYSGRHYDCNLNHEYDAMHAIFRLIGLKVFETSFGMQSFTHLIDMEKAYKKSGEIMYAGIDLGVDFLCVFGDSTLNIFDKQHNLCTKYCKRDKILIPILNLAQILLISFGQAQQAAFHLHNIKPDFIYKHSMVS